MTIHPYFSHLPERDAAEAFSELMVPGLYKNNYLLNDAALSKADGFPPEPSYLTSVTAVYTTPNNVLRRVALHGISGPEVEPKDSDLVDAYDSAVTELQQVAACIELAAPLLGMTENDPRFGRLGKWCVDTAAQADKRVAAAHLTFVSMDGKRLHHGLTYPTEVKEQFPLILRDFFKPVSTDIESANELFRGFDRVEELKDYFAATLRNDEDAQMTAGIPPSALMIPTSNYRMGLKQHRKHQQSQRRRR